MTFGEPGGKVVGLKVITVPGTADDMQVRRVPLVLVSAMLVTVQVARSAGTTGDSRGMTCS